MLSFLLFPPLQTIIEQQHKQSVHIYTLAIFPCYQQTRSLWLAQSSLDSLGHMWFISCFEVARILSTLACSNLPCLQPHIPVLSTQLVSVLGEVHSPDLRLHCGLYGALWYSSESGKDREQLPATQSLQQSTKLGAVANVLADLVLGRTFPPFELGI